MVSPEMLSNLKERILKERKAVETFIRVKFKDGRIEKVPVFIILRPTSKVKFLSRGIPITVGEIYKLIKDKATFEEQQKAVLDYMLEAYRFINAAENVKKEFNGEYLDFK